MALVAVALVGACASSDGSRSATPSSVPAGTSGVGPVPRGVEAGVVEVTDGDTLVVEVGGREERVRLIGINTPERGECFADEATAALAGLVEGGEVRLVVDQSDRDDYGRLLRDVYVGDTFVNEDLVRDGFALANRYEPDVAHAGELEAAQAEAEAAGRGLWAPDACGRPDAAAAVVVVEEIEADPPGDDTLDPNAEYVVVRNTGDGAVDLTGWGIKDESASHRFAFPDGFSLAAGAAVTVHTGCGADTGTDLFWCNEGSAVWNNDGDTAFLLDPSGNVVDTRTY